MENIKNVLYIHGINSSGSTGKMLEIVLRENFGINVYHPEIPSKYDEARNFIDNFLNEHEVDLIIGASLGGFMVLDTHGYYRIAVNPTMKPSKDLKSIGISEDIYSTYENIDIMINFEDKMEVFGVFGAKDEIVNYKDEFERNYFTYHTITVEDMDHQMFAKDVNKFIVDLLKKVSYSKKEFNDFLRKKDNYKLI